MLLGEQLLHDDSTKDFHMVFHALDTGKNHSVEVHRLVLVTVSPVFKRTLVEKHRYYCKMDLLRETYFIQYENQQRIVASQFPKRWTRNFDES